MNSQRSVSFENTSIAFSSKSDTALRKMHFLFRAMNYPLLVNLGTNFLKIALKLRLPVKPLVKRTIFELFCGGESVEDCREKSLELNRYGIGTILDYSVEGTENEEDLERTANEILNTVKKAGIKPKNPFVVFKPSGIGSNLLFTKIHLGETLSDYQEQSWDKIRARVISICEAASQKGVRVLIDAEETWIQKPIDHLAYDMMRKYNSDRPIVFNTFQMYLKDMYQKLQNAFSDAVKGNYHLGVKLVRGAYLEKERERAQTLGYQDPIQIDKDTTDEYFNKGLEFCVEHLDKIALCCGSHNEYSNRYLTDLMEKYNIRPDDPRVFFSQLYGMGDNISFNLSNAGYNVTKYLPYGPVNEVIPYLFRRAEENTSIAGQSSREYVLIRKELARRSANRQTS